jgi:CoA:oxalate CoA-transferase
MVAQGYSGLMSITGPEGGPPCRVGSSVGDIFAGHQATIAIMAALMHREKTGRGQHFDGAMIDGLFTVLENAVVRYTINGEVPGPLGSAHPSIVPFQSFPTKDDLSDHSAGQRQLVEKLLQADRPGGPERTPQVRHQSIEDQHRKDLEQILIPEFRKTRKEWLDLLGKAGLPHLLCQHKRNLRRSAHRLSKCSWRLINRASAR